MRFFRSLFYHISQGIKNIFRNGVMTIASLLVLVSCMVILGTFYLVISNIDENFNNMKDLNMIEVRIPSTYTEEQTDEISKALSQICNETKIIPDAPVFVSKEEHLARFKEQYGDQEWSSFFNEELNPLRPSFEIEFENFSDITEVVSIVSKIESVSFSDGTKAIAPANIKSCVEVYRNVMSVKKTLYTVGIWLMCILLVISLFVIMNTIKLGIFARRNEIIFMRYCGATKHFIRMPFLVEGGLIGIFSAAIAIGVEYLLYTYALSDLVRSSTSVISGAGITVSPFTDHILVLSVMFAVIGLFAGIIAGSISLKKYLKA